MQTCVCASLSASLSLSPPLPLPPLSPAFSPTPFTSYSAGLQLSRRALRPALYSPKAMQPCICAFPLCFALSPSLSLSLLLTHSLPFPLPPSLLLPWHLPFGSARLQLSRGALRLALCRPQDYITMRLRIYLSLPPLSHSLPSSLLLSWPEASYLLERRAPTEPRSSAARLT